MQVHNSRAPQDRLSTSLVGKAGVDYQATGMQQSIADSYQAVKDVLLCSPGESSSCGEDYKNVGMSLWCGGVERRER
jgi:hypothetical protein